MLRDPFSAENEASLYVPRRASEEALAALHHAIRGGPGVATLVGPVGIGKSMLLKVLESRLAADHCCVRVDYEGLSAAEFCQWILRELDARETLETERVMSHRPTLAKFREWVQRERSYTDTDDPEQALVQLAGDFQSRGFPVVLLIDSADGLKPETAQRLVDLSQRANGALSLVFAVTDGMHETPELLASLGSSNATVPYDTPMTLEETIAYVKERLSKAQASDELRACLDESRIRRLFKYSQGNPRRLHGEVGLIHLELSRVRAGIPAPPTFPRTEPMPAAEPPRPWLVHSPEVLGSAERAAEAASDVDRWTQPAIVPSEPAPATAEAPSDAAPPVTDPEIEAALAAVPDGTSGAPSESDALAAAASSSATVTVASSLGEPLPFAGELQTSEAAAPAEPLADAALTATPNEVAVSAHPPIDELVHADEPNTASAAAPDRELDPTPTATPIEPADSHEAIAASDPSTVSAVEEPALSSTSGSEAESASAAEPTSETRATRRKKERITRLFEKAATDGRIITAISDPTPPSTEVSATPDVSAPLIESIEPIGEAESAADEPELAVVAVEAAAAEVHAEPPRQPEIEAVPSTEERTSATILATAEPVAAVAPAAPVQTSPALTSPDAESAPEVFAEARRDWEQFAREATPLSQVQLPQAPAAAMPTETAPRQSFPLLRAAAALVVTVGLGAAALALWSSDEELPDVSARTPEASTPAIADTAPEPSTPAVALEPEPTAPSPALVLTNVNAKPWATIEIDGRLVGETPLGDLPLTQGPHLFRATLPGGRVIERTEMISADNSRIVFE